MIKNRKIIELFMSNVIKIQKDWNSIKTQSNIQENSVGKLTFFVRSSAISLEALLNCNTATVCTFGCTNDLRTQYFNTQTNTLTFPYSSWFSPFPPTWQPTEMSHINLLPKDIEHDICKRFTSTITKILETTLFGLRLW